MFDFIDRIGLFIRVCLLSVSVIYMNPYGNCIQKQVKRITDIVYSNHGDESVRSSQSETCSVAEGAFSSIGSDESDGSTGTRESHEETGSDEHTEEESDESEDRPIGISDDTFRFSNVVHQRGF